MRKAMRSNACGVTSNALGWLHAFPGDHAVSRLHAPWGDMKLPLYVGFNRLGFKTAVISGGFLPVAQEVQKYLGLDYAFANTLEVDETTGLLTGKTSGPVVTPQRKRQLLATIANVEGCEIQQTIAVGDGANDIPMLHAAGLGIAFCAKPKVQEVSRFRINQMDLSTVLFLIGISERAMERLSDEGKSDRSRSETRWRSGGFRDRSRQKMAHLRRITEGAPRNAGVVVLNEADVPIGFGVTARSTDECTNLGAEALVVYHQADVGEYLREEADLDRKPLLRRLWGFLCVALHSKCDVPPAMSHEIVPYGKGKGKSIDDAQLRKFTKRTVDYGSDVVRWMEDCAGRRTRPRLLQRHYNYTKELVPPFAMPRNPYDGICPRFVYAAVNKNRSPVYVATWFPNGRRILTGTLAGEMTIWNGLAFHSENVMQAHNAGIKAMCWTPDEAVMVSGDQLGMIKLWDPFIYNFQTFQGHKDSVCDIAVAPTGEKFCSCADDSHAKVWDLKTGEEERAFTGHGWDVKCCAWHPTKGLVATGSKDSQIKLWDPRASEAITTIFCHKNTVTRVAWSPHGQWLASASRDQLVMLMDVRTMSVRKVFKAHQKEVTSLCWHPESDSLLASGGYDGAIHFWGIHGSSSPVESLPLAHEGPVWSLAWHPMGHLLVSASNVRGRDVAFGTLGEEKARKQSAWYQSCRRSSALRRKDRIFYHGEEKEKNSGSLKSKATPEHVDLTRDDGSSGAQQSHRQHAHACNVCLPCNARPYLETSLNRDEDGHAALTFYPLGSSRQALVLVEEAARKAKLRLLCANRPGNGSTSPPLDPPEGVSATAWHLETAVDDARALLAKCCLATVTRLAAGSYVTKSLPSTSLARAGLEKEEAVIFDREAVKMAARFRSILL
eukprot:s3953_g12.t1